MRQDEERESVLVTGIGFATALGLDVENGCAAARAGISRASQLTIENFAGDPLWGKEPPVGHTVRLADGFTGYGKVLALGSLALEDVFRRGGKPDTGRTGLYVNLSDRFLEDAYAREAGSGETPSTAWRNETASLLSKLIELSGIQIP